MTRRRVEQLEDRAGVSRAAWHALAHTGERLALDGLSAAGASAHTPDVRRVFLAFRAAWGPGADPDRAADAALNSLHAALPAPAYGACLAALLGK